MSLTTSRTWEALARDEIVAARVGGLVWQRFVQSAVGATGLPWSEIREIIDPYVKRLYREGDPLLLARKQPAATLVRIEADELDGGFVAVYLDEPGCASQGETEADTLRNLADALEGVRLAAPPPAPKPERKDGDG